VSIEGKGIVITGGASGLGLATVAMLAARGARIAIIEAHPSNAHYAATKAAVVSLTRSFALEFGPDRILVNSVAPAGIATPMAKGMGFLAELAAHTPLGRNAEPEDIAEWIVFMLGDANRYMTGENVIVSGGYVFA
jgi:3-oxoacyl-[acyl-carrier protein] reductase